MSAILFDFSAISALQNKSFAAGLLAPLPEPEPYNDINAAYELGFMFGRQERACVAPTDWAPVLVDAFYGGHFWGDVMSSADKQADYDQHIDRQAEDAAYSDRMQSGFHPAW